MVMAKEEKATVRDWFLGIIGTFLSAMIIATYIKVGKVDVQESQIIELGRRVDK